MFGKIIGTGKYVPHKRVTNLDLSEHVETDHEWIVERTGIECRHMMETEATSDMASLAAQAALEDAGVDASEIDMIIVSTVSADALLPNMACQVQSRIGAGNAACFDLNTACTGFIMAYNTVQSFIHAGLVETALIIGAEGLSKIVDWEDRGTCILFGDGAGAAVIKKDPSAVFDTVMHADGTKGDALSCGVSYASRTNVFLDQKEGKAAYKDYVEMDGRAVFGFAIRQVPQGINELLEKIGLTVGDMDCFLLHQANKRIVESIAKRLGVDMAKVPMNLMEYGNTSSASIPILLDEARKAGTVKEGDKVIMSGFGAGLTWAATYIQL